MTLRDYEALLILPVTLDDEGVGKAIQGVKDELTRQGGSVVKVEMLGKRVFARQMKEQGSGYYARILLELPAEKVDPLLARLKLNDDIFRIQILRHEPVPVVDVPVEADAETTPVEAPVEAAEVTNG